MIDRTSKKLESIHANLRDRILSREWKEGEKLPTEAGLAKQFDCSIGTVSKAVALLAHDGLVKRRTRLGTHVVWNPAEPKANQLDSFAFIYPSERHEGIWRTVSGFQDAAREADRRVVTLSTGTGYKKEAEYLARLSEFDVRGAVVYPLIQSQQELVHFSQMLMNSKFPVVLAWVNLPGIDANSVVIDGFHAGYTMTRHMIARGAKRIGYFSNYAWIPSMRERHLGYRWALEEAGIPLPENGMHLDSGMHPDFTNPLAEPTEMAEIFLKNAGKLEAVVCAGDFLALGCIAAARKLGRKVPNDLLISGIDDYNTLATSMGVSLTTYHIPFEEMGRKAFAALERVTMEKAPSFSEIQVRGTVIIRESA